MDPLSELLAPVRLRSALWIGLRARAPWGVAFPATTARLRFHLVVAGRCWLSEGMNTPPIALAEGDLVVVPFGREHALRDHPRTGASPQPELAHAEATGAGGRVQLRLGGRGAEAVLTSGVLELEDVFAAPVLSLMPPILRLPASDGAARSALVDSLRSIAAAIESRPPGSDLLLERMAGVIFVQLLAACHEAGPVEPTRACQSAEFIGALRDPNVAAAIRLMNRHLERPWTVASLAAAVGLSRSAFAARFLALAGQPPLRFLTRLRMSKATALLRDGATLARASELLGYASEASFSHAFRQWVGVTPGAYRRTHRANEAAVSRG